MSRTVTRGLPTRGFLTRGRIIAIVVVIVILAGGYLTARATVLKPAQVAPRLATAQVGTLTVSVGSSGSLLAEHDVNLTFSSAGNVGEVLVKEGDKVSKGTPLARLDQTQLQLQVDQAQASLSSSQAKLEQVQAGATQKDLDTALAALQGAQAKYQGVAQGSRSEDIAAAKAAVDQAQAKLESLQKGATSQDIASAQAKVNQAQINLTQVQQTGSNNKQQAEMAMEQSANLLRDAQNKWNSAYWDWQKAKDTEADPVTGRPISDRQIQAYKDTADAANLAMQNAQTDLDKAKDAYAKAQQDEGNGNQTAQAQLDDAKAQLAKLQAGSTPEDIRAAQAGVDQAQANYNKLVNGNLSTDLAQAQSQVDQAAATYNDLLAGPKSWDIAVAMAGVNQAQAQLKLAQTQFDLGELKAPFDGVVQAVPVEPGQAVTPAATAIQLVDVSKLHVDASVSESDIAKVQLGQEAAITLDALPGQDFQGKVTFIAPQASTQQGVVVYNVTIELTGAKQTTASGASAASTPAASPTVVASQPKSGMTASVNIILSSKDNVLTVPSRAIRTVSGKRVVSVWSNGKASEVTVETGLSNDTMTEIVSGLKEGEQVVIQSTPSSSTSSPFGGGGGGL
jgi:HlyD family secretion protein